jgi:hypothetical protein
MAEYVLKFRRVLGSEVVVERMALALESGKVSDYDTVFKSLADEDQRTIKW